MLKISEWSVPRRIESLRQMDKHLSDIGCAGRYTVWKKYGLPCATEEETTEKLRTIAQDDELYNNALFYYMVCTLEKQTLKDLGF